LKQVIRIIGGKFRGKKLYFPDVEGLRPTPDRVRETLFNWLMHDIHGARCLDAFAGSGALGLEAFSRGASQVTFVEKNTTAYAQLEKNIQLFSSDALQSRLQDACDFMRTTKECFDLVFLDPPYLHNLWPACLSILETAAVLKPGGLLYMESPQLISTNENTWETIKLKTAGQVFYGLFRKK